VLRANIDWKSAFLKGWVNLAKNSNFARLDRPVKLPHNFAADSFRTKKLCSRLSSKEIHVHTKNGQFAFLSSPLEREGSYCILVNKVVYITIFYFTAWNTRCICCLWREWLTIDSAYKTAPDRVQADHSTAASPATSRYPAYCKFDQFVSRCHIIKIAYVRNSGTES